MPQADRWIQFQIAGERYALPVDSVAQVVGLDELRPVDLPGWVGTLPVRDGLLPVADGGNLVGEAARPAARRGLVLRGRHPLGFTADDVLGLAAGSAYPLVSRVGLPDLAQAALPAGDGTTLVLDADRLWRRLWAGLQRDPGGASYRLRPLQATGARSRAPEKKRARKQASPPASTTGQTPELTPEQTPVQPSPAPPGPRATRPPRPSPPKSPLQATPTEAETPPPGPRATRPPRPSTPPLTSAPAQATPPPEPAQATPEPFAGGRVLVFRAGLQADLAVPAEQVLEVGPARSWRPLQNGPKHLAGLLEWRGRLLPVVDLPARLGASGDAGPRQTLYLALRGRAAQAVAVSIGDLAGAAMAPPVCPGARTYGVPSTWVRGVARLGQRPLVVLDPAALLMAP